MEFSSAAGKATLTEVSLELFFGNVEVLSLARSLAIRSPEQLKALALYVLEESGPLETRMLVLVTC